MNRLSAAEVRKRRKKVCSSLGKHVGTPTVIHFLLSSLCYKRKYHHGEFPERVNPALVLVSPPLLYTPWICFFSDKFPVHAAHLSLACLIAAPNATHRFDPRHISLLRTTIFEARSQRWCFTISPCLKTSPGPAGMTSAVVLSI